MTTVLAVIAIAVILVVAMAIAVFMLAIVAPVGMIARAVRRRRATGLPVVQVPRMTRRASGPRAAAPSETEALRAALRRDATAGNPEALAGRLRRFAPDWPAVAALSDVADELGALQRNLAVAMASGTPRAMTDRLTQEVRAATAALAARADRLAATAAIGIDSSRLREGLAREELELRRMIPAIRESRAGLAELTLAGADGAEACRRAERQFRSLAAATRELLDLSHGGWGDRFASA
jgi:hypothetical protein